MLHDYQQRHQTRQRMEEVIWANVQQGLLDGGGSTAPGQGSGGGCQQHCDSTGALPPRTASLRAVQGHERQWAALEASFAGGRSLEGEDQWTSEGCGSQLAYEDIPWPPGDARAYLEALTEIEQLHLASLAAGAGGTKHQHPGSRHASHAGGRQRQRAARKAYAKACLRYHPDKFQHRWGLLLRDCERQQVLSRVQEVVQGINQAWETMQEQAGGRGSGEVQA